MNNRICAAAFLVLSGASALAAADCARPPAPPAKSEWGFVRELATPPVRTPRERFRLADDYGCGDALKTALDDLGDFLGGSRELRLAREKVEGRESYRITVSSARVTLAA